MNRIRISIILIDTGIGPAGRYCGHFKSVLWIRICSACIRIDYGRWISIWFRICQEARIRLRTL
jgi:hypothetical protein